MAQPFSRQGTRSLSCKSADTARQVSNGKNMDVSSVKCHVDIALVYSFLDLETSMRDYLHHPLQYVTQPKWQLGIASNV